eukprot:5268377-Heterocapsa_arctica.AAC.1
MSHDLLDTTVRSLAESDTARYLCARHHDAMTMLFSYDNPGRVICMKPMQGDMHGDVGAPQKFCLC